MSIWIIADIIILALVGVMGYFSMKKGFLSASYSGVANFLALLLVFSFHTPFEAYLSQSSIGDTVRDKVRLSVEGSAYSRPELALDGSDNNAALEVLEGIKMPEFMSEWFVDMVKTQENEMESFKEGITEGITDIIYSVVMQILSIIILYLGIRLILWIGFCSLKLFMDIPVFGTIDKVLGAAIGGINALLIIYIISALLMLLVPVRSMSAMELGINNTYLFKFFYYNNLLTTIFLG